MSTIKTWYLEMTSPSQLREVNESRGLAVTEAEVKQFQLNRFLYTYIGEAWQWFDKLNWSDEQWRDWAEQDDLRTWIAYEAGSPAGFYELNKTSATEIEIVYFGLAPKFIGRGYGAYLLSRAVKSAWEWQGTERVWLRTCTLDHSSALNNYQSRGFEIYRQEEEEI